MQRTPWRSSTIETPSRFTVCAVRNFGDFEADFLVSEEGKPLCLVGGARILLPVIESLRELKVCTWCGWRSCKSFRDANLRIEERCLRSRGSRGVEETRLPNT